VGFILHKKVGDRVAAGEPLCTVHYNSESLGARARTILLESFEIGEAAPATKRPLVHRVISKFAEKN
jgi:pyrimidine-nucleoside phosphorylase